MDITTIKHLATVIAVNWGVKSLKMPPMSFSEWSLVIKEARSLKATN